MSTIKTGQATFHEVELLLLWAEQEGWNPGLDDAAAFHAADPQGFFIAYDVDNGKKIPVAGVSVVRQNDQHAFLGLYLCLPEYRGRGYGLAAWNAGLQYAGQSTIGLDGVPEQQSNYRRSGFTFEHRTVRYSGVLKAPDQQALTDIREARSSDVEAIINLDRKAGGLERSHFYKSWLSSSQSRTTHIHSRQGNIDGVITLRRCAQGFKIGPLLAESDETARQLIAHVSTATGSETVLIDVPEPNNAGTQLAHDLKLLPVFETARMYRGRTPDMVVDKLFGVATLELG